MLASDSTMSVSSLECWDSSIQWCLSRLLNCGSSAWLSFTASVQCRWVIHSMCKMASATASGWWASTALATASGGPISSHFVPKPRSNSSRKRRNRWMCLASSAANPSSARTA